MKESAMTQNKEKKESTGDKIVTAIKIPFVAAWVSILKLWAKIKR
jgi:hypothetical protein